MADEVNMDMSRIIGSYVEVRDKKSEIAKRHKEELAPYNDALANIEAKLLMALNAQNLESIKTGEGTAFKTVRSTVKIQDWELSLQYIIDNDLTHVLERRLSKTAVAEFVENNGANFPGTSIDNTTIVQVRRK